MRLERPRAPAGLQRFWQQAWTPPTLAVLVGVAAVVVRYRWPNATDWVPDLAVGWGLCAFGLLARTQRPESRSGTVLYAAGLAWFIGNAAVVPFQLVAASAGQLALLHRAILAQAVLTAAQDRVRWTSRIAIVLAYILYVAFPAAPLPVVLATSLAAVAAAAIDVWSAPRPSRNPRLVALGAAVVLAGAYSLVAIVHEAEPSGILNVAALLIDEAALLIAGALALYAVLLPKFASDRLTDLVVELRGTPADGLRDSLATALGDPFLAVGYWDSEAGAFLDASGAPVPTAVDTRRRAVTVVDVNGMRSAAIVHDPAIDDEALLRRALDAASGLAAANARLREQLLDRLVEVRASRRRLLLAADAARAALERRLGEGPIRQASIIAAELDAQPASPGVHGSHIQEARAALSRALEDLHELGRGLHPRALHDEGLDGALRSIIDGSPVPVSVETDVGPLPDAVALAAYFACAEGVANAVKHGHANRIMVRVQEADASLRVAVDDDGVGGADIALGRGLRGIADRIEALGGLLSVQSAPGDGTHLRASLPLTETPQSADT